MAHIVIPTFLLDSSKNAIIQVYLESDGVSGDLSNFVLVDPKTDFFDSPAFPMTSAAITQIWYGLSWFDAFFSFDDLTPSPSWQLTRDSTGYHDFRYFGGIRDRSTIDGTGKILLTTSGMSPAGSRGTIVFEVRKNRNSNLNMVNPVT